MGIELGTALLIGSLVAGAGTVAQTVMGVKGANAQKRAQKEALKLQDEATNKANQKRPNPNSILAANTAGQSPTMLTGVGGVDTGSLSLGKTSLLGS